MIYWGINALNHGSSFAVFKNKDIVAWERFPDDVPPHSIFRQALDLGTPDRLFWYERPWIKKTRQLRAGQWRTVADLSVLPSRYLKDQRLDWCPVTYTPHHGSHAAAGYYTSPFDDAAVVVLDAIGEWECASIWRGQGDKLTKVWSRWYPDSLGLFYSAFTKLIGLEPIKEEYLLQQMSQQGDPDRYYKLVRSYIVGSMYLSRNLHRGVRDWPEEIANLQQQCDIAAAVQRVFEETVSKVMHTAKDLTGSKNLVYMGGCAMNSLANNRVVSDLWQGQWSLSNPGDPSSAIGAVLYHTQQRTTLADNTVKHLELRQGR
jgi:carbamoyltransferase